LHVVIDLLESGGYGQPRGHYNKANNGNTGPSRLTEYVKCYLGGIVLGQGPREAARLTSPVPWFPESLTVCMELP